MIYLFILFAATVLFFSVVILFRGVFYQVAEHTLGLLNAMMSAEEDTVRQKEMISKLTLEIVSLGKLFFIVVIATLAFVAPIYVYANIIGVDFTSLDFSSLTFFVVLTLGSLLPFVVFSRLQKDKDYSELSILLHHLILDNYNVSKYLFSQDNRFLKSKELDRREDFVIVSGLARAGTTSFTTQLFELGNFCSLNYSNLPFLLAPNLWKKFYSPKNVTLKERSHGDKVMVGLDSVEALEEYFFKVHLDDSYISKDVLTQHEISEQVYKSYIRYQALVRGSEASPYLSKNNNLLLRYNSMRSHNQEFKAVFLFRSPVDHAYSLLSQHRRFCERQQQDKFVLDYMNWLGHHEFGNNQKPFHFDTTQDEIKHDRDTLNYWLCIWVNYYRFLLEFNDDNMFILDYSDYLNNPKGVFDFFEKELKIALPVDEIEKFSNRKTVTEEYDEAIYLEASNVFESLIDRKVRI